MDWCVNQNDGWPFGSQPSSGSPAAMGRAVVSNDEHATGGTIRFLAHDLSDQTLRTQRYRSCVRSCRTAWHDARPRPQGKPTRRHARIRARHRPGDAEPAATSGVCAAEPECWSSRQCTERNHAAPVLHLSTGAGRDRGRGRLCGQTVGRAGRSRCDGAKAVTRPG